MIQYLKQIEDIAFSPDLAFIVCLIKPSCCLWHITDADDRTLATRVDDPELREFDLSNELLFRVRKSLTISFLSKPGDDSRFEALDIVTSVNNKSAFLIDEIRTVLFDNDDGQVVADITGTDVVTGIRKSRDTKTWPESKPLGNVVDVSSLMRMSFEPSTNSEFDLTLDDTEESVNTEATCSVPVLLSKRVNSECITVQINIDALAIAPTDTPAPMLLLMFRDAVYRQSMALNLIIKNHNQLFIPSHFLPSTKSAYPITAFVPSINANNQPDDVAQEYRRFLHKRFFVSDDRPVFKTALSAFSERKLSNFHLINPHEGLNVPMLEGGKVALVQGKYAYNHYMQDNFDDSHWGCAYRSLQTLASWFWLQGYTERRYPSHEEIQKALVEIGDKEANFVGSREWIGSMEVSYCLDQLFGVTSKTLYVSSGADMTYKGRELYQHFLTQGTPVMIGGGVLAHTIVGVVFNEDTGDTRFLIVDPHFTGNDTLKTVLSKGWVGWKGPDFWNQTAHYNMCMPQRPKMI